MHDSPAMLFIQIIAMMTIRACLLCHCPILSTCLTLDAGVFKKPDILICPFKHIKTLKNILIIICINIFHYCRNKYKMIILMIIVK